MKHCLKKILIVFFIVLPVVISGQAIDLEMYRRYIEQIRQQQLAPSIPSLKTEYYTQPELYTPETLFMPITKKKIAVEESLYFDEPIIVGQDTVQWIRKAAPKELRRFGEDIFSKTPSVSSWQLPVDKSYIIGAGDELLISLWGGTNAQHRVKVDRDGKVYVPEVGQVAVAGLSISDAEKRVAGTVKSVFANTKADITLADVKTIQVFLVGGLKNPGIYDLPGLSKVVHAIASAGGLSESGSFRHIGVFRNNELLGKLDLYQFIREGKHIQNVQLATGDVIVVYPSEIVVKLRGRVRIPAIFELRQGQTLKDLLEYAGGFLPDANREAIFIDRVLDGRHITVTVNASDSVGLSFPLKDGDDISVFPANPVREASIFLDGYVPQPGAYGWYENMKLSDVFRDPVLFFDDTYWDRVEVIRRLPDGSKKLITSSMKQIWDGDTNADVALEPFDLIYLYSIKNFVHERYVYIAGAVKKPGIYDYLENIRVSDVIYRAGGITPEAYLDTVVVAQLVNIDSIVVYKLSLKKILENPRGPEDMLLQKDDFVHVRSIPGWKTQRVVTILGEVRFPGDYALTSENEPLSSIISRAGGFTPEAFLKGVWFIRPGIAEEIVRRNVRQIILNTQPLVLDTLGRLDTAAFFFNWSPVGLNRILIDIQKVMAGKEDIVMKEGDTVLVPKIPDGVSVIGSIASNGTVKFKPGENVRYYIKQAGGLTHGANVSEIRVIKFNGTVVKASLGYDYVEPGDVIVVPRKVKTEVDLVALFKDIVGIFSGIATTVYILLRL